METDAFFYQLFNQLPQTLFELIGLPAARAKAYRFDSVELKKAFRIDGLFVPKRRTLPLYVEVQFQRVQTFYANLFAKVFSYLEENDPGHDWVAVAIFASRKEEPKDLEPYEDLLQSKRVMRVYLEDLSPLKNPPVGLGLLQLLLASEREAEALVPRLAKKAESGLHDSDLQAKVVELLERLLMIRFPGLTVEDIRMKFKLHDIRESKAWQEIHEQGLAEGRTKGLAEGRAEGDARRLKKIIETLLAKRKSLQEISDLLDIPLDQLRQAMKTPATDKP